jgi:hypothetical protein
MEEAPGIDLSRHPHGLTWMGGRNAGKRRALELHIAFTARNPEQAQLAVEDLHRRGIALLDAAGNRVEPGSRNGARFSYHRFDEEEE